MNFLFEQNIDPLSNPLAHRIRPQSLKEFIGQDHLISQDKLLYKLIEKDNFSSLIFYGEPGVGKTTLCKIIGEKTKAKFINCSGFDTSIKQVKTIIEEARERKTFSKEETILFIDEFHRFSKSQQDSLLASIEEGILRFVGATTHNLNFAIIPAILSRSQAFYFEKFSQKDLIQIVNRALVHPKAFPNKKISIEKEALEFISTNFSDARQLLILIENIIIINEKDNFKITLKHIKQINSHQDQIAYDIDQHYDTISAYIKSMRDNSVNEALFWLAKMLKAGEDILFIARRLIIFSAEDIGNADPQALILTESSFEACHKIGMPEAKIILSQATIYCATAPKSRASYEAINLAFKESNLNEKAPKYRVNSQSMSNKNNQKKLNISQYYKPAGLGYEKIIKERLAYKNNSPTNHKNY